MHAGVPTVEVADHADARGVGGPHREEHAVGGPEAEQPGAQGLVGALVGAFAPQMAVELTEGRAVAVRIVQDGLPAVGRGDAQPIVEPIERRPGQVRFEHARLVQPRHRRDRTARLDHDVDCRRPGTHGADDHAGGLAVRTEHAERIAVAGLGERIQVGSRQRGSGHRRR